MRVKDIIKLEDGNEYVISGIGTYNDQEYYYLIDMNSDDNVKFGYIDEESFAEVKDKDFIRELLPIFLEK